jgi:DNA-binding winged helix-turn-helix (wHTH) protein
VIRYSETPPVASSRTRTGQEYDSVIGAPSSSHPRVIRFGTFELILESGELRRDGVKIKLQEQPFQLLSVLLEKAGDVVTREQLQQRLWPADTFVDFDHSLNAAVRKLRTALGDSAEAPRFIETLAKRGYRFIAPVDSREIETAAEAEWSERLGLPAG